MCLRRHNIDIPSFLGFWSHDSVIDSPWWSGGLSFGEQNTSVLYLLLFFYFMWLQCFSFVCFVGRKFLLLFSAIAEFFKLKKYLTGPKFYDSKSMSRGSTVVPRTEPAFVRLLSTQKFSQSHTHSWRWCFFMWLEKSDPIMRLRRLPGIFLT